MEAICSSETSVETEQTTWRHIPEDDTLLNLFHACVIFSQAQYQNRSHHIVKMTVLFIHLPPDHGSQLVLLRSFTTEVQCVTVESGHFQQVLE
jgi:hypothetical protein